MSGIKAYNTELMLHITESSYPITFRAPEATRLGDQLRQHNSVAIIGMKRVGISNFLRFFLYHEAIEKTYIHNGKKHVFIPVDLNDLVERDIYPFWTLILKRVVDTVEKEEKAESIRLQAQKLFSESIQLKDLFFTVDAVRKILASIAERPMYPTLFLIRFDRLKDVITPALFDNLQGIKDAAHQQLSYVFTSFRPLHEIAPQIFKKSSLTVFSQDLYITPASEKDMRIILETFQDRYHVDLSDEVKDWLIQVTGGHVQYLQLALIKIRDENYTPKSYQDLLSHLVSREEVMLQSEELFDSLTKPEQHILLRIQQGTNHLDEARKEAPYLWETGMVKDNKIFCPLLAAYIQKMHQALSSDHEFTKKEFLLFSLLKDHHGELCERDDIIHTVWPEYEELGVSDWAIDRLVARVRAKLKVQKSPYEIVTIITRGYKLVGTQ